MAGIIAVFQDDPGPCPAETARAMAACAPHRGRVDLLDGGSFAIGIQRTEGCASLVENARWSAAMCGFVGNLPELMSADGSARGDEPDLEWLLRYLDRRGAAAGLASLRGAFAMVARDKASGTVFAARDATGLLPLFHARAGRTLVLASEIRQVARGAGISAQPDRGFLVDFIGFHLRPTERTAVHRVSRVVPGEVYTWAAASLESPNRRAFWSPPDPEGPAAPSVDDCVADLRARLDTAITRTAPQRPFGVGLSGGLDSSSVWALACADEDRRRRARAYSIVFPGAADDESAYMRAQVEHTGLDSWTRIDGLRRSPLSDCETIAGAIDTPWVRSLHQVLMIGEALGADGRRVFLTGLGGDEWLDGSIRYLEDELASGHFLRAASDCFRIRAPHLPESLWWRLRYLRGTWLRSRRWGIDRGDLRRPEWMASKPWGERLGEAEELDETLRREPSRSRADLLLRLTWHQGGHPMEPLEQLSAVVGLDIRHPLMDLDLVEFAFRTPARMFYSGARSRHLLRLALTRELAPAVRDRLDKGRYRVHEAEDLASVLADYRKSGTWRLVEIGIVDPAGLARLVVRAERGDRPAALSLLDLYPVEAWLRRRFA